MTNKIVDELTRNQQAAYEAFKQLADINVEVAERLFDQHKAVVTTYLEASTEQVGLVTDAKDYKALLNAQSQFAKDHGEKLLTYVQETSEILDEARERLTDWVDKGLAEAAANNTIKPAA